MAMAMVSPNFILRALHNIFFLTSNVGLPISRTLRPWRRYFQLDCRSSNEEHPREAEHARCCTYLVRVGEIMGFLSIEVLDCGSVHRIALFASLPPVSNKCFNYCNFCKLRFEQSELSFIPYSTKVLLYRELL